MQDETTASEPRGVITIAEIAAKLNLKLQPNGDFTGANPIERGATDDGFTLFGPASEHQGTGYDRKLDRSYEALEVAHAAGLKNHEYHLYAPLIDSPEAGQGQSLLTKAREAYTTAREETEKQSAEQIAEENKKQFSLAGFAMTTIGVSQLDESHITPDFQYNPKTGFESGEPLVHYEGLTFRAGHFDGGYKLKLIQRCMSCSKEFESPVRDLVTLGKLIEEMPTCPDCQSNQEAEAQIPDLDGVRYAAWKAMQLVPDAKRTEPGFAPSIAQAHAAFYQAELTRAGIIQLCAIRDSLETMKDSIDAMAFAGEVIEEPPAPPVMLWFMGKRYPVEGLAVDELPPIFPEQIHIAGYTYLLPPLPRPQEPEPSRQVLDFHNSSRIEYAPGEAPKGIMPAHVYLGQTCYIREDIVAGQEPANITPTMPDAPARMDSGHFEDTADGFGDGDALG